MNQTELTRDELADYMQKYNMACNEYSVDTEKQLYALRNIRRLASLLEREIRMRSRYC